MKSYVKCNDKYKFYSKKTMHFQIYVTNLFFNFINNLNKNTINLELMVSIKMKILIGYLNIIIKIYI